MSSSALAAGLRRLRGQMAAQQHIDDSDEQLLHAFLNDRDDSAFAALVRRHGPMVLHICRRVLGHEQDAEDAFQATFVVLSRQAAKLRKKASLVSWLYGIAYRMSLKAKQAAARRRKYESQASTRPSDNPVEELSWREVRALVDAEIARLPEAYRSVFILCCLENVGREEAARRLCLKPGTVASRFAAARKRLGQRLTRRGVELTAVLAASAAVPPPASALPVRLIDAVLATATDETASVVSASVAALANSGSPILGIGKGKLAALMLLIAGLGSAGVGLTTHRGLPAPRERQGENETSKKGDAPASLSSAKTRPEKEASSITVRGRVLAPDGKPAAGARIYWPRVRKQWIWSRFEKDLTVAQRGVTDSQGRFHLELSSDDVRAARNHPLVAAADGYGVAGTELPHGKSAVDLTLRLLVDRPIRGRIVNTEGKPLAGIRVRVLQVATTEERLDTFLTAWKQYWNQILALYVRRVLYLPSEKGLLSVVTDKEGRFAIRGAGKERVAVLQVQGPGIAQGLLYVVNRPGFDPEPYLRAIREHYPSGSTGRGFPPLLSGPTFDYVADPARPIEGVIREAGSGKPVAGAAIWCEVNHLDAVRTVSDAKGRYRLDGLAKNKKYWLGVDPVEKDPWLRTLIEVTDTAGWQPLRADVGLARGVIVTGQVLDRKTGKGVPGGVRYVPLLGNKYFGTKPGYDSYRYGWGRMATPTDAEGRFRLVVIPGLSALAAENLGASEKIDGIPVNPYKSAEFDPTDRKRVSLTEDVEGNGFFLTAGKSSDNSREYLKGMHAVKVLDLAEDAGPTVCNLSVDRGKSLTVRVQDKDGKPLSGVIAAGLAPSWPSTFPLKENSCTVYALDPKRPRQLAFFHPGRRLAGTLTVRGDEKEAPAVRLASTGTVTGRILDPEGKPISSVRIYVMCLNPTLRELDLYRTLQTEPISTGKDGRFRWEGVVPDQKFYLGLRHGRTYLDCEPRQHPQQVKPGATLDLGDVRTTPLGDK